MKSVMIPDMVIWLAGVFTPLLTAGIAWLIRNSIALSERVAVMDSKLSGFATTEQHHHISQDLALLQQRVEVLEKKVG